jgi:hypothetical protein
MGVLASRLFTEGDPATLRKLEDCAVGRPTEVASHFRQNHANAKGEHIVKVQQALKTIQQNEPNLDIPEFDVNGVYDAKFARAVAVYKQKRDIRNFANKIDDIIGIKTIQSLDSDVRKKPRLEPPPRPSKPTVVPRPLPRVIPSTCLTDDECPAARDFVIQLIVGGTGGEILEAGFFVFIIQDQRNRLSCLYSLSAGGLATPGLPITPSGGGDPTPFSTSSDTKVTRFGPIGGITSLTKPKTIPLDPRSETLLSILSFSFRSAATNSVAGMVFLNKFDTGPISIPGAGIHGGKFTAHGICKGGLGADKTA